MKNVSILGCGWLGKPLALSFLEDGYHVKGSTTSVDKLTTLEALEIEPYLINIEDFEEYDFFLNSDILIIAITSKNTDAFEELISQIQASSIQKVIFISSTSVYPSLNRVVTEADSTLKTPLTEIENMFRKNTFFETTIIRFAGLFGKDRHPSNWFSEGRKITQPKGFVNMIHQEDCIEIIHEIINQNCWGQTFNACSNDHPTRELFYTKAKIAKGLAVPEFAEAEKEQWKIISANKLQQMLNYTFIHDDLLSI